jgi:hypothetical protein
VAVVAERARFASFVALFRIESVASTPENKMNDLSAVFQSEVFRPVVDLVVPGFYAASMGMLVCWQRIPQLPNFVDSHATASTLVLLLIVLTFGLIVEDLGSRVETVLDACLLKTSGFEEHIKEWYEYLRIAYVCEPIGHRYLRSLVLRLKFELGMAAGSPFFITGVLLLKTSWLVRAPLAMVGVVACVYFLCEAKSSNKTLSELRRELLKKFKAEAVAV